MRSTRKLNPKIIGSPDSNSSCVQTVGQDKLFLRLHYCTPPPPCCFHILGIIPNKESLVSRKLPSAPCLPFKQAPFELFITFSRSRFYRLGKSIDKIPRTSTGLSPGKQTNGNFSRQTSPSPTRCLLNLKSSSLPCPLATATA